ncbi:hypothetical protein GCM10027275_49860 [Rhabdobacter roseus]|uniref:Uncharacterized protein n=1 Tax=Rhabdobacter roseus TaxID=1655419 RepID=A0A840U5F0_9BACT|nr:hypothetical protein [Rhabdobacter roseus]MBB5287049.1 hypothetical protein [Rhabdobacter roseus]
MEDQPSHAKRKQYEPHVYARLLGELTQLMDDVPKLYPDRNVWDIEGDWNATGVIYFVDAAHKPLFSSIKDFDCRTIKLVNLGRPAARITFYRKHRYWLLKDKDIPLDQKIEQIRAYLENLAVKSQDLEDKIDGMTQPKRREAMETIHRNQKEISTWHSILDNITDYELALSNYSRLHFYVTVNYKYRLESGEYANEQEHLLNPQRDRAGNVTQLRYNIIFVDPVEILRDHPYQNREVEGFLNNFPIKSEMGRNTIYARPRPENVSIEKFK